MRRLTLATLLALLPLAAAPPPTGCAARPARQCPAVKVSCPDSVIAGEEVTFTAELAGDGAAAVKPAYVWQVSAGTIVSGQGAPSVKVDTTGLGWQSLTVTVEVNGLPESCERKSSCTTAVMSNIIGCGFDEYGDIRFDDEKARLDNFAIELQNDPTASGYLICYGGRRGYEGEARLRCDRAKNYLTTVRYIEAARVVTVDGGFREELSVKLSIVPSGATPPAPSPTVDARDAVILKRRAGRPARLNLRPDG